MSDLPPRPAMGPPTMGPPSTVPPAPAVPPPGAADRSAAWRPWILLAAVAVLAMLVGAGAATAVVLAFAPDGPPRPQQRYETRVTLTMDATAEQKAAVEAALTARYPADGVRLESRAETWERFREVFKDDPELLDRVRPDDLPESFLVRSGGRVFDCAGLAPVERLPGVDQIRVRQLAAGGLPDADLLGCP
ncbi:permease-like cell division protein FtsX [Plantactinospora sp. CA-290183]|uniref:permease-like cell division protein FtsX n=1 Tax=Plantactinospora sp. CA-290183 TaxID=3240006 RepID=UPI003D8CCB85